MAVVESPGTLPDVIIPIHNAPAALEACLESVLRTVPQEARVLLLDDASGDTAIQPLIKHYLDLAGPGWVSEYQAVNLGFVGTVNRGMQMTQGNVVLLNSDTIVTPGWLQGLQRCLDSSAAIATATPWSNNGEIVSLPRFCANNPVPVKPDLVAGILAATGAAGYPELPTAVGFCMAISRRAINRIGLFDEQLFGLGYGEENDFSRRATQAGFRNVLCDDVYVAHLGGCSFLPRGLSPDEQSMRRLLSRHPDYLQHVEAFITADPLAERRSELLSALRHAGIAMG
jgi:GT2 family glycosyltransferase